MHRPFWRRWLEQKKVLVEDGEIVIRFMKVKDIEQVLRVEHASFPTPWTKSAFQTELKKNNFAYYLVAEVDQQIVGYCGVWIIINEAHITNIAIHPDYRGRKIGERLMYSLIDFSISQGADKMTLEVRISNCVAQQLYRKLGFTPSGIRKKYYTDNNEDAMIMWVKLDEIKPFYQSNRINQYSGN